MTTAVKSSETHLVGVQGVRRLSEPAHVIRDAT